MNMWHVNGERGEAMFHLEVADYLPGVMNMLQAADIRGGETVMLLADRRSDPLSIESTATGLKSIGAIPMVVNMEKKPLKNNKP